MTKQTMWKNYRGISGAHNYAIGFIHDHKIFVVFRKNMKQDWLSYEKASRNQGMAIRLRLKVAERARLATSALCLGSEELLTKYPTYNKGENLEALLTEHFGQVWKKDTLTFTQGGDIRIGDIEVQIKFNGATFTNEKTLARQMARG